MREKKELSDEEVIKLVREDNKELYADIIKRYQDKLMRYAVYLTQEESKASDIVQDSFIKAYINLNSFDLRKKFSSWIYRIVHNEAMNAIRKDKNNFVLDGKIDFDSGTDLEDSLIRKELKEHAQWCLSQLPVMYREPLSLFFLEEKSYEEISDILRIPTGTVGTRISRAKAMLKKICQKIKK